MLRQQISYVPDLPIVKDFKNTNLTDVVTPIKVKNFEQMLRHYGYDRGKTEYLIDGFTNGFDMGYRGPTIRQDYSRNIPFSVGDSFELWDKIMKEVQLGRYAGPFESPPYTNFMQSPVGLVPKAGNKTRLIFHLSYNFSEENKSFNHFTEEKFCTVKYRDLDYAIKTCLELINNSDNCFQGLFLAKSDLTSAFRILPGLKEQWKWLLLKAEHPLTGRTLYFVDKNIPFGASASCFLFTAFSDSLKFLVEAITGKHYQVTNYLDDFLFVETSRIECNRLVQSFITLCTDIGCPIAHDKTEWADQIITFLGILIDGKNLVLSIPEEKRNKALAMLRSAVDKSKLIVKDIQKLTGTLNFLNKALIPGRAFSRRMYNKLTGFQTKNDKKLKYFHHVTLDSEFLNDCRMWIYFLSMPNSVSLCRPFLDILGIRTATELDFYTDASASKKKGGFGCFFSGRWNHGMWEPNFVEVHNPSIEYLELYALCVGIFTWSDHFQNQRIIIFCDNMSVVNMVNQTSSKCKNCMVLI